MSETSQVIESSVTHAQLRLLRPTKERPVLRKVAGSGKWSCGTCLEDQCIGSSFKGAYARWRMSLWKAQLRESTAAAALQT